MRGFLRGKNMDEIKKCKNCGHEIIIRDIIVIGHNNKNAAPTMGDKHGNISNTCTEYSCNCHNPVIEDMK